MPVERKGRTDLGIDHIVSDLSSFCLAADDVEPGIDLNRDLSGPRIVKLRFLQLEAAHFEDKIWTRVFSGADSPSVDSKGAALNMQAQSYDKDQKPNK
ncbi:hypothetical protein N7461_001051 [Penicillium sp. DV-2018c]|nr:hypothetical protein N7461_001051 [Penicillium sp. DV-2018c]